MIDTHCHLTDERLFAQLDAVLHRATGAGVNKVVTIATTVADSYDVIAVCKGRDNVRCTVGIHPNNVAEEADDAVAQLPALLSDPSVVAMGEFGLDYHYDTPRDRQRKFFIEQLTLAQQVQKPVVIHCREAVDDTLAVMKDFKLLRAIFHCFTGTLAEAEKILTAGYWLGFTGVVTFKKSDELRLAVAATPMDRIVVETDAPWLSPEPHRGQKVNEPSLVIHTARTVAKVKNVGYDEIDTITTRNAEAFYDWT